MYLEQTIIRPYTGTADHWVARDPLFYSNEYIRIGLLLVLRRRSDQKLHIRSFVVASTESIVTGFSLTDWGHEELWLISANSLAALVLFLYIAAPDLPHSKWCLGTGVTKPTVLSLFSRWNTKSTIVTLCGQIRPPSGRWVRLREVLVRRLLRGVPSVLLFYLAESLLGNCST